MMKVDRGEFYNGYDAYEDHPCSIGFGATISAPHMHAYCLVRHIFIEIWLTLLIHRNG